MKATKVYWHELAGNRFNRNIECEMISTGVTYHVNARKKSDSRSQPSQLYEVIYDRSYVVNYLAKKIVFPLFSLKLRELMNLLKEAKLVIEEQNEQQLHKSQKNLF